MTAVIDYFEVLGLRRRVFIDNEALRARYRELSKQAHPDAGGTTERAALLNDAQNCLSATSARLKHFIELEFPEAHPEHGGQIPPALMDLFLVVAAGMQKADAVISKHRGAQSAVVKALLKQDELEAQETLENSAARVRATMETLERTLDGSADDGGAPALAKLQELQRTFAFLEKWRAQIRAKLLALFESVMAS